MMRRGRATSGAGVRERTSVGASPMRGGQREHAQQVAAHERHRSRCIAASRKTAFGERRTFGPANAPRFARAAGSSWRDGGSGLWPPKAAAAPTDATLAGRGPVGGVCGPERPCLA